jgi:histidine triad (HIT) family protein
MEDSIFTKIIKGEIPSHKVYEDDKVLAFLDITPTTPGHTLVIPKKQVELVWDLNDDEYHAVMAVAKRVAQRLQEVLGVKFVGEKIIGTDVPHAHVHVFALTTGDQQFDEMAADHDTLAAMAEKLRFS